MTRLKSVLVALALVSGMLLSMGQIRVQRGWQYVATNLLFSPDNTWTIGGSAANRPSTVNVGTSVVVAGTTTLSGTGLIFGANANKIVDDGGGIFRMTNSADVGGQLIWTSAGLALKQGTGGGATDTSVFVTNVIRPTGPAITAGAATGLTVNDTGQIREVVYKATVASTAFVSAAVTSDVTIGTLPAKTQIVGVMADLTQTFACASTCTSSTLSMVLGRGAGGAQFLASFDADAAAAQFGDADAELGTTMARAAAIQGGSFEAWASTQAVVVRLTSGTGNIGNGSVTNLSQGSVTFYLVTRVFP